MPSKDDARSLAAYPHRHTEVLRFRDLDSVGHVTSVAIVDLAESGRMKVLGDAGIAAPEAWIPLEQTVDYLGQLKFPGQVVIGTVIHSARPGSVVVDQALFDGDRCVATITTLAASPALVEPGAAP